MATAGLLTKRRIALIEDDVDVMALVHGTAEGHVIDAFADGRDAVTALTSDAPLPQVVLLDLDLPGMHGLEVLKQLRLHPRTRRVPVVIFTATELHPEEGYRLGANAWVRKSADATELERTLRSVLEFWTGFNLPASPQG